MLITKPLLLALGITGLLLVSGCGTVTVYKDQPPEVITKYYTELRDFESEEEFIGWLEGLTPPPASDECMKYGQWLMQQGANDGYFVYYISSDPELYEVLFPGAWPINGMHALNWVVAGDVRIYVDTTNGKMISPTRWGT